MWNPKRNVVSKSSISQRGEVLLPTVFVIGAAAHRVCHCRRWPRNLKEGLGALLQCAARFESASVKPPQCQCIWKCYFIRAQPRACSIHNRLISLPPPIAMELFGDLSSYNAAATLRVSSIVNSLDNLLYSCSEPACVNPGKFVVDDARSRSMRNPLLLMFRQA